MYSGTRLWWNSAEPKKYLIHVLLHSLCNNEIKKAVSGAGQILHYIRLIKIHVLEFTITVFYCNLWSPQFHTCVMGYLHFFFAFCQLGTVYYYVSGSQTRVLKTCILWTTPFTNLHLGIIFAFSLIPHSLIQLLFLLHWMRSQYFLLLFSHRLLLQDISCSGINVTIDFWVYRVNHSILKQKYYFYMFRNQQCIVCHVCVNSVRWCILLGVNKFIAV